MSSSSSQSLNMNGNVNKNSNNTNLKEIDETVLIPLLASRSCHLPGNTWKQDWVHWFKNHHILFGICCHHKLHPVETWERCLLLAASVSFGLVATNLHLIFQYHVYVLPLLETKVANSELLTYKGRSITPGLLMIWFSGGIFHSIFDLVSWHIMACACFHPGGRWHDNNSQRYKDVGSYTLIPLILALLALAIFLVLLRASHHEVFELDDEEYLEAAAAGEDVSSETSPSIYSIAIQDWRSFAFLSKYAMELAIAWFVAFPVVGTIVFSGILGCGGISPVLGGRPYDMKRVEEGRYRLFDF